jgi:hypothetical protein
MLKVCSVCGRPSDQARCHKHRIPARTGTYSRNAAIIRAAATVCQLCGRPFNPA